MVEVLSVVSVVLLLAAGGFTFALYLRCSRVWCGTRPQSLVALFLCAPSATIPTVAAVVAKLSSWLVPTTRNRLSNGDPFSAVLSSRLLLLFLLLLILLLILLLLLLVHLTN